MIIQPFNPIGSNNNIYKLGSTKSNSRLRFTGDWNQVCDIGTSHGLSAKIQLYSDKWEPLSKVSSPKRITTPSSVQGTAKYSETNNKNALNALVEAMANNLRQAFSKDKSSTALGRHLILFVPGQIKNNVVSRMGGGSDVLHQFDLKPLSTQLQEKLKTDPHLKINHETQITAINDMAGGAASAISQLAKKHPEKFIPGLDATYLMSGGGLGLAGISYEDDKHSVPQVKIHLMELACLPNPKLQSGNQYTSLMNPLLAARLEEFAAALPERYHTQKAKIIDSRNTQIVTEYTKAREFLPSLTEEEYLTAACHSAREYLDLLGGSLRSRIATGSNLAILGGKTCAGYRDFVNSHPTLFKEELDDYKQNFQRTDEAQKSTFDRVFLVRTRRQLPEKLQGLFDMRHFDIVSDVNVDNNTEGAPYIAKGWFQNRSDRFAIPASAFRDS